MATPNIPVCIGSDYDHDDDLKTLLVATARRRGALSSTAVSGRHRGGSA